MKLCKTVLIILVTGKEYLHMNIILFICGAFIVISIHELGHYIMIKLCCFNVEELSIGIGPKLFSYVKKHTKYSIRLIPIGGYVTSTELDSNYESPTQSIRVINIKRILCYLAGPLSSLILSVILLIASGNIQGIRIEAIYNQQLIEQGIKREDTLRSINGNRVFHLSDIETLLHVEDSNTLTFTRNNEERKYVQYTVSYTMLDDVYFYKQSYGEKFNGMRYMLRDMVDIVIESVGELFTGKAAIVDDIYNPYSHSGFKSNLTFAYNFNVFLIITAVFSWCLFVFNLLPIIGFDGFKSIYSLIPVITNRKLSMKTKIIIFCFGVIISIWIIF